MYVKSQYCRNAGLGNKLFPWARAIVIAEIYDYKLIDSIWFSPRGASIIRGGVEYRKSLKKIWLLNNFIKRENDISFVKVIFLQNRMFKLVDNLEEAICLIQEDKMFNLCFKWNTSHNFSDLYQYKNLIFENLRRITRNESLSFIDNFKNKKYIGLNIRTGKDFVKFNSSKVGYCLTEIDWFINALALIREKEGNLPALIVSDGGYKELKKILKQPNTQLLKSTNAIEDLLVLANSKILLGSGNSTFSAWASFLGGMNTFSSIKTPFNHFKIASNKSSQIIGTL